MCSDFDRWVGARVDTRWWRDHEERWAAFARTHSPDTFAAARRRATRTAALLGALPDRLVFEDDALTRAVACEEPGWRTGLVGREPGLPAAFALQLETYRLLELLAVAGRPPDEALVKLLHELVCRSQATYSVSEGGRLVQQTLPRGRYKSRANHSPSAPGSPRYVDVGAVDDAMGHFVAELARDAFASAHPVVQGAYALHTLLAIHPFADGNGRVARALASIYLLRALSLPFFVEGSERRPYLDALRRADTDDVQPLVGFVTRRCCATIALALDCAMAAPPRHA
jgi:Fic/DOC family protein